MTFRSILAAAVLLGGVGAAAPSFAQSGETSATGSKMTGGTAHDTMTRGGMAKHSAGGGNGMAHDSMSHDTMRHGSGSGQSGGGK